MMSCMRFPSVENTAFRGQESSERWDWMTKPKGDEAMSTTEKPLPPEAAAALDRAPSGWCSVWCLATGKHWVVFRRYERHAMGTWSGTIEYCHDNNPSRWTKISTTEAQKKWYGWLKLGATVVARKELETP